jgi:hypothetical protein
VEEAFEEGQGPFRFVESVMIMMMMMMMTMTIVKDECVSTRGEYTAETTTNLTLKFTFCVTYLKE